MTTETLSPSLTASSASTEPRVNIQQMMSKRHSFAVQGLPEDHRQTWPPQVDFQANPQYRDLTQNRYEVTLNVRLQAKHQDKVVFELQLDQAGLFILENISAEQKDRVLYGACPNLLFPTVGVLLNLFLSQAGLPPVYLAPLDFMVLYHQHLQRQKEPAQTPKVE